MIREQSFTASEQLLVTSRVRVERLNRLVQLYVAMGSIQYPGGCEEELSGGIHWLLSHNRYRDERDAAANREIHVRHLRKIGALNVRQDTRVPVLPERFDFLSKLASSNVLEWSCRLSSRQEFRR